MSWLFSQALVAAFSEANSSDGEPSAQLNVMPTPHKFWRNDKTMEFSSLSRFGLTCAVLTESRGEALLTWYRAGFRARTYPAPDVVKESLENAADCGENLPALLARYDHATHSLKTAQCSLFEDLTLSCVTLPRWGSMQNGELYQRQTLVRPILESEFGSEPNNETFFHTPLTGGLDGGSKSRKALKKRMENWPTPTAHMAKERGSPSEFNLESPGLGTVVLWFPTPQASDNRDRGNMSNPSIQRMLSQSVDRNSGQLNPPWVEWLMGWPLEWTDLKPLATGKSRSAPQQHGVCLHD